MSRNKKSPSDVGLPEGTQHLTAKGGMVRGAGLFALSFGVAGHAVKGVKVFGFDHVESDFDESQLQLRQRPGPDDSAVTMDESTPPVIGS